MYSVLEILYFIVYFLLGNSPVSEIYMPTFRNTLFHLHRPVGLCRNVYLPMKMEQTECSETSSYKFQTPGNYPKESIQHLEHGESLKSRILYFSFEHSNTPCIGVKRGYVAGTQIKKISRKHIPK
jgi:hypothetical protein